MVTLEKQNRLFDIRSGSISNRSYLAIIDRVECKIHRSSYHFFDTIFRRVSKNEISPILIIHPKTRTWKGPSRYL